jgi:ABC-type sugar transport system permease subunit
MAIGELDIGVAPLPRPADGRRANVIYAAGWCVPKTTDHPDWALRLAAYLAGAEAARVRSRYGIGIPGRIDVARLQAERDRFGLEHVFIEETQYGRQSWGTRVDEFSRIETITRLAVDEVMIGGRDIHEAFTEAAQTIDTERAAAAQLSDETAGLAGNREVFFFLLVVSGGVVALAGAGAVVLRGRERKRLLTGYSFLFPSLVILVVFIATPIFFSLFLSFHRWNVVSTAKPFIGLENFARLAGDRHFWNAFRNTAIYTLHVPVGMAISLAIAVLMNRRIRGVRALRTLFFLPSISSFVAVAIVWQWIYHPQFGLANFLLRTLHLPQIGWLSDPATALASIMLMSIWLGLGYQMVIFLAGLQGIPRELYEAAITDGASAWQRFIHITLPLLRPTIFFVLVTSLIGSFQVFSQVFIMTSGGPLSSTDVVVFHIYQNAWDYLKMGYASAMSWVLFIIIMVITWLQFRVMGRRVEYG